MDDEIQVMEVYDQTKFIEERNQNIKKIKNEAKQINEITVSIKDKVVEQDYKLDTLEKELGRDVSYLKKANQELHEAENLTKGDNSSKIKCLVFLFLVVVGVGIALYFILFTGDDKPKPDPTPKPQGQQYYMSNDHSGPTHIYRVFRLLRNHK